MDALCAALRAALRAVPIGPLAGRWLSGCWYGAKEDRAVVRRDVPGREVEEHWP